MEIYLKYFLMGLTIALPIGTITIEMTKQGIKHGFLHGWAVGLGGMTVDFLLIIAIYLGLAPLLSAPLIQIPLWLLGAVFLFYLAYDSIKNANHDMTMIGEPTYKSIGKTYRNGILVAISPSNLIFWISIFGVVLTDSFSQANTADFFITASGILSGILVHDIILLTIISVTRKAMNKKAIMTVSIIAGILLFGFGCTFLYKFFITLQANYPFG
ncbi:LysE family transporter [Aeribacillus sp. FSL K6-2848]|uniref:LysE family transporter n=2 Tax=Bacillaceae TaxID=186817 RepID=UPI0030CCAA05